MPRCGTQLSGGWTQRTRAVIELSQAPVHDNEHVYIVRTCAQCRRRCASTSQPDGVLLGQQRPGINLVILIAALREEARLPFRTIRWYLDTVHRLHLEPGAMVDATQRVAQKAQSGDDRHRGTDPGQSGDPWRRDRLARGRTQRLRVDLQYSHRTLLPAEKSLRKLFVLAAHLEAPADNNAAERSSRLPVVSCKVKGATHSQQGTETKMTPASIFPTWRAQGLNTLTTCKQLPAFPQS